MGYKYVWLLKIVLLVVAIGLAGFLAIDENKDTLAPDQKVVFVLDVNRTMNTQDVFSWDQKISRLQAAKLIISKTVVSQPGFSYGLILFNVGTDYIVPPTFDTGTYLLYLSWITTNLLWDWAKNFSQLSWLLHDDYTTYVIVSDFDTVSQKGVSFKKSTSLLWIGSLEGDQIRYANGIRYYASGNYVSSARNDVIATSLNAPYISLTRVDGFDLHDLIFSGFDLPMSQRIVLYALLWILVVLVVFL